MERKPVNFVKVMLFSIFTGLIVPLVITIIGKGDIKTVFITFGVFFVCGMLVLLARLDVEEK